MRAYKKFLKQPTKTLPPLPDDYVCVYLVVYRGGRILTQIMKQVPATGYAAATDGVDVRIGKSTLQKRDGRIGVHVEGAPWKLTSRGPITLVDQTLAADLVFTPTTPDTPHERPFLSREMTGADHHWVIANPVCEVAGEVKVTGADGSAIETITFRGRGYHDHNYGTAPLGPGLKNWAWGRAISGNRGVTFHYAVPQDQSLPPESHLVIADEHGTVTSDAKPIISFDRKTSLGLAYPSTADWPGVMRLAKPRVIDASPFYLRLQYDADLNGEKTTAFCEAAYPHRLRWPVLGRMIEMSIDKRGV
ncbi:MAG: hypothetical protein QM754_08415 [Tepidisphaeraceae bacterium]